MLRELPQASSLASIPSSQNGGQFKPVAAVAHQDNVINRYFPSSGANGTSLTSPPPLEGGAGDCGGGYNGGKANQRIVSPGTLPIGDRLMVDALGFMLSGDKFTDSPSRFLHLREAQPTFC